MSWQPGDRVKLLLPDKNRPRGGGFSDVLITGTVREIDTPGLPRGVRVDLDRPVNGVRDCYASHDELEAVVAAGRG